MSIFIKFLIYVLHTADGKRDTGFLYLDYVNNKQKEAIQRFTRKKISSGELVKLKCHNESILFNKIAKKYLILKIRLKISFIAS